MQDARAANAQVQCLAVMARYQPGVGFFHLNRLRFRRYRGHENDDAYADCLSQPNHSVFSFVLWPTTIVLRTPAGLDAGFILLHGCSEGSSA